jgi:hypothetical protein
VNQQNQGEAVSISSEAPHNHLFISLKEQFFNLWRRYY